MEGIGRFTYDTLIRIVANHPEHRFYFLFDRPFDQSFVFGENVEPVVISPPARHPFLWYIWFEWRIPAVLKQIGADVFISTDGYLSLRSSIPTLLVIHDLAFENMPGSIPWLTRKYYQYFTPKYAHKAKRILTVSEFSKKDMMKLYDIPAAKIDIAPNAANPLFKPFGDDAIQDERKQRSDAHPYFLFVSALQPRKNLPGLLLAFDVFKQRYPQNKTKLIVAGSRYKLNREIDAALKYIVHSDEVIFTGHLPQNDLVRLVGAALALVYVSFFEGFGIPIIEAMQAGVPVICSNTSSMPWVAGNAALLVNPDNTNEISDALEKISNDKVLRQQLIKKGIERAKMFSWEKTATIMWKAIKKL